MSQNPPGYEVHDPTLTSEWRRQHPTKKKVEYTPEFKEKVMVNGCCKGGKK